MSPSWLIVLASLLFATMGACVKLVSLDFGDAVTAVARVVPEDEREGEDTAEAAADDSAEGGDQLEIAPEE